MSMAQRLAASQKAAAAGESADGWSKVGQKPKPAAAVAPPPHMVNSMQQARQPPPPHMQRPQQQRQQQQQLAGSPAVPGMPVTKVDDKTKRKRRRGKRGGSRGASAGDDDDLASGGDGGKASDGSAISLTSDHLSASGQLFGYVFEYGTDEALAAATEKLILEAPRAHFDLLKRVASQPNGPGAPRTVLYACKSNTTTLLGPFGAVAAVALKASAGGGERAQVPVECVVGAAAQPVKQCYFLKGALTQQQTESLDKAVSRWVSDGGLPPPTSPGVATLDSMQQPMGMPAPGVAPGPPAPGTALPPPASMASGWMPGMPVAVPAGYAQPMDGWSHNPSTSHVGYGLGGVIGGIGNPAGDDDLSSAPGLNQPLAGFDGMVGNGAIYGGDPYVQASHSAEAPRKQPRARGWCLVDVASARG